MAAIRLDRMQAGLVAWVQGVLPSATVAWGRQHLPRDASAQRLVTFNEVSGPIGAGASVRPWTLPTTATVLVGAVSDGDYLRVTLSGTSAEYQVQSGETTEEARDGLLAALQATDVAATFTAVSTDKIRLVADSPGDLYHICGYGVAVLLTNEDAANYGTYLLGTGLYGGQADTPSSDTYLVQLDEATYRIEMQISDKRSSPRLGASAAMAELFASTDLPVARQVREDYGLRFEMGTPIALDRLAGPAWESRRVVDLRVTLMSISAAQATRLARVVLNIDPRRDGDTLSAIEVSAEES